MRLGSNDWGACLLNTVSFHLKAVTSGRVHSKLGELRFLEKEKAVMCEEKEGGSFLVQTHLTFIKEVSLVLVFPHASESSSLSFQKSFQPSFLNP